MTETCMRIGCPDPALQQVVITFDGQSRKVDLCKFHSAMTLEAWGRGKRVGRHTGGVVLEEPLPEERRPSRLTIEQPLPEGV